MPQAAERHGKVAAFASPPALAHRLAGRHPNAVPAGGTMADPDAFPTSSWSERSETSGRAILPADAEPGQPGAPAHHCQPLPAAPARALARSARLALVAGVLLVLLGAAAVANPATRDAIAHFFQVRGVIVSREPSPHPRFSGDAAGSRPVARQWPMPSRGWASPSPCRRARRTGRGLCGERHSGGEISLATHRARASGRQANRLGVLVSEFRGDLNPGFIMRASATGQRPRRYLSTVTRAGD